MIPLAVRRSVSVPVGLISRESAIGGMHSIVCSRLCPSQNFKLAAPKRGSIYHSLLESSSRFQSQKLHRQWQHISSSSARPTFGRDRSFAISPYNASDRSSDGAAGLYLVPGIGSTEKSGSLSRVSASSATASIDESQDCSFLGRVSEDESHAFSSGVSSLGTASVDDSQAFSSKSSSLGRDSVNGYEASSSTSSTLETASLDESEGFSSPASSLETASLDDSQTLSSKSSNLGIASLDESHALTSVSSSLGTAPTDESQTPSGSSSAGTASLDESQAFSSTSSSLETVSLDQSQASSLASSIAGPGSKEESQAVSSEDETSNPEPSCPHRKRKVALWIGYVGTAFRGLQIIRGAGALNTVENELERALYSAGAILDTNFGNLEKISWSRSSRTDKGVHSLATVISMKMEVPPTAWTGDPDGLLLADAINAHLPTAIQVFGIVPVTKSFDARRFCSTRTYQYFLPASLIGILSASSPSSEHNTSHLVDNFRSVLNMFQGRFAFHNYTVRSIYRASKVKKTPWLKSGRRSNLRSLPVPKPAPEDEDEQDEEPPPPPSPLTKSKDSETRKAYWLDAPDVADKVSASHFRKILECSCGEVETFAGHRFIRISITGESFMVHQIRKIVATAVAVSTGVLPEEIIPLSLCRHARIILPLAPSEGLVLARNSFYPFRQLLSSDSAARLQELPKLELTMPMSGNVDTFWRDVLLPELAPQLDGSKPIWREWGENLSQGKISETEIEEVQRRYTNWREVSRLKMEEEGRGQVSESVKVSTMKDKDTRLT